VFLWSILTPQRWSALAPDFVELEENVAYTEREDEFDIHPIEEIHKRRLDLEDDEVDVLTTDIVKAEFEPGEFRMPILLSIERSDSEDDVIPVGTGQFRRKSPGQGKEWLNDIESGLSGEDKNISRGSGHSTAIKSQAGSKRRRTEG
jgi:COMPASS component SWD1